MTLKSFFRKLLSFFRKRKTTWDHFQTHVVFKIEEILPLIRNKSSKPIELNGYLVHRGNKKLRCFKGKGVTCVKCGIEGKEFRLQSDPLDHTQSEIKYFLNLYAFKKDKPILMTVDHIIPK